MPIELIGATTGGIRGGQWKAWLNLKQNEQGEYTELTWISSDATNALIYAAFVFALSRDPILAALSFAAMWAGAFPGLGDYRGAMDGRRAGSLKENRIIDFFIAPMRSNPRVWGFFGMTLRGAWWGLCLAAPFAVFGRWDVALQFLISGSLMGVVDLFVIMVISRRYTGPEWHQISWAVTEIVLGSILWAPLRHI
jgi:hypothetical protein